jgi:hypothetical protein
MKTHRGMGGCSRLVAMLVGLVGVGAMSPQVAVAQDTSAHSDTWLQRVAAAVDGFSGGAPLYVVICGTTEPYEIVGAFPSKTLADEAARTAQAGGKTCSVAGPFYSDPTYPNNTLTYAVGCKKQMDSSCPISDSSRATVFAVTDIVAVKVTAYLRGGRIVVLDSFPPQSGEAIFFTMSAIDKLLMPYLVRVYGVEYAAGQRQQFLRRYLARSGTR